MNVIIFFVLIWRKEFENLVFVEGVRKLGINNYKRF